MKFNATMTYGAACDLDHLDDVKELEVQNHAVLILNVN